MTLGELLKDGRKRAGMSLRDVEKISGISNGYLSLMESDAVKSPSPNHLHALAEVYGASYSLLMELAGYIVPQESFVAVPQHLANEIGDLSIEEQSQVRSFVGYLKSSRGSQ
jgi:transcriptional regulator with XRE-family HTH domain